LYFPSSARDIISFLLVLIMTSHMQPERQDLQWPQQRRQAWTFVHLSTKRHRSWGWLSISFRLRGSLACLQTHVPAIRTLGCGDILLCLSVVYEEWKCSIEREKDYFYQVPRTHRAPETGISDRCRFTVLSAIGGYPLGGACHARCKMQRYNACIYRTGQSIQVYTWHVSVRMTLSILCRGVGHIYFWLRSLSVADQTATLLCAWTWSSAISWFYWW